MGFKKGWNLKASLPLTTESVLKEQEIILEKVRPIIDEGDHITSTAVRKKHMAETIDTYTMLKLDKVKESVNSLLAITEDTSSTRGKAQVVSQVVTDVARHFELDASLDKEKVLQYLY